MKSKFNEDLSKEKRLSALLDSYYKENLKYYNFERIHTLKQQHQGIDLILSHKTLDLVYYVDEKAQLDYINESLPTFAFELCYTKNGELHEGWLFDAKKKTHFYALVTSIYEDEPDVFTSCSISFVNRKKLLALLATKGITRDILHKYTPEKLSHGKTKLLELDPRTQGYLYHSRNNKAESPINLVLRLDYLKELKIAKNLGQNG